MNKLLTKIKPAPGYVLIEPLEEERKTPSGIVLPDSHEEKPQAGRVVSVGETLTTEYGTKIKSPCAKGDLVVFKKWAGNEYRPQGANKDFLFVKFDDVMAIIG